MIYGFDRSAGIDRQEVAALTTDVKVRVLNVSATGCLLETNKALEIGRAATLQITFLGGDFEELVQIVRCQEITGGGAVYHIATAFLTTTPPSIESLRYLIRRESGRSTGWIRMAEKQ